MFSIPNSPTYMPYITLFFCIIFIMYCILIFSSTQLTTSSTLICLLFSLNIPLRHQKKTNFNLLKKNTL